MSVKSRQAENSAATRAALLKIARKLFAERGYAETTTEEVVRRARVTRGALYHHFLDKQDLFKGVLHEEERKLTEIVAGAAAGEPDPWRALKAGSEAFLDACLDPAVRQIVLIDAPAVLGSKSYREIDASYFLAGIKQSIRAAIDSKLIPPQPVDALAHLLMGALHEASLLIAYSENRSTTRSEVSETIARLFAGIRQSPR
jgi:AcrR family transcriptional regulator